MNADDVTKADRLMVERLMMEMYPTLVGMHDAGMLLLDLRRIGRDLLLVKHAERQVELANELVQTLMDGVCLACLADRGTCAASQRGCCPDCSDRGHGE